MAQRNTFAVYYDGYAVLMGTNTFSFNCHAKRKEVNIIKQLISLLTVYEVWGIWCDFAEKMKFPNQSRWIKYPKEKKRENLAVLRMNRIIQHPS